MYILFIYQKTIILSLFKIDTLPYLLEWAPGALI